MRQRFVKRTGGREGRTTNLPFGFVELFLTLRRSPLEGTVFAREEDWSARSDAPVPGGAKLTAVDAK